jgi:hypothetical protein
MSVGKRATAFCIVVGHCSEVEDKLYTWIDVKGREHLTVSPSLDIGKAKLIADVLSIFEDNFQASWRWLKGFRAQFKCRDQAIIFL